MVGDLEIMQLRIFFAATLYLGSYLPLSVILLTQDIDANTAKRGFCSLKELATLDCALPLKNPTWSLAAVAICALGLAATVYVLRILPAGNRITVTESKHVPADLINYIVPYVVSFMSLEYEQGPKLIGFGIFLLWMFWVTYKSGQVAMNPVLAVLGWKLYEIKYTYLPPKEVHVGRVLSRRAINPGHCYRQNGLQDVLIVNGNDEEGLG